VSVTVAGACPPAQIAEDNSSVSIINCIVRLPNRGWQSG
jgi:hypothetical protein